MIRKDYEFEQELRCELTLAEVQERAHDAACLVAARDRVEEKRQADSKTAKAEIDSFDARIRELSREVREHATHRMVPCVKRRNEDTKMIETWRLDTNDLIHEREMTAEERQLELLPQTEAEA